MGIFEPTRITGSCLRCIRAQSPPACDQCPRLDTRVAPPHGWLRVSCPRCRKARFGELDSVPAGPIRQPTCCENEPRIESPGIQGPLEGPGVAYSWTESTFLQIMSQPYYPLPLEE